MNEAIKITCYSPHPKNNIWWRFQVEDYDENILKDQITTLQPSDIEVTIPEENLYGSTLGIGEKMWLPFTIQIPPDVVTPMEVST